MALRCPMCASDAVLLERRARWGAVACLDCGSVAPADMVAA